MRYNGYMGRIGQFPRLHDREQVIAVWRELGTQRAAAKKLGILQSTVSKVLIAEGIHVGRGVRPPVHDLPRDEIVSRYLAGETCGQMAPDYNVDYELIRSKLRMWGIARRTKDRAWGERNNQWKGGRSK